MSKRDDKRQRVIRAATTLFSRYGFKRTSVDLLAREAGVAKPTVYAYFEDKEAIFRAVVESVCDELVDEAARLAQGDATTEQRLVGMLGAKFTRYFELVQASPHAHELVDSHGRLGAEIVQRADRAFARLLTSVLEEATDLDLARAGLTATSASHLLLRAASGAAYDATSVAHHRRHLAEIVRVLVLALRRR